MKSDRQESDIQEREDEQQPTNIINFSDIPSIIAQNQQLRQEVNCLKEEITVKEEMITALRSDVQSLTQENSMLIQTHLSLQNALNAVTRTLSKERSNELPTAAPNPSGNFQKLDQRQESSFKSGSR